MIFASSVWYYIFMKLGLKKYIPGGIFLQNKDVFGIYSFLIYRRLAKSPQSALRLSNFILIIILVASVYAIFRLHSTNPIQVDSYYNPATDFDKEIY